MEWGQDLAAGNNPVLAAVINDANKGVTVKSRSLLSLPAASVALLTDGTYALTVTVSNFLGQSATAKLSFSKVGSGTAPVISIVGGPTQSFKIADGVNLASSLEPTSVCAGKTVSCWHIEHTAILASFRLSILLQSYLFFVSYNAVSAVQQVSRTAMFDDDGHAAFMQAIHVPIAVYVLTTSCLTNA
jgi:hypothetical protein